MTPASSNHQLLENEKAGKGLKMPENCTSSYPDSSGLFRPFRCF